MCITRFGRVSEDALAKLPTVPRVRAFIFDDEFTAQGWNHLGRLHDIEHLECWSSAITDDDLQCLKELPQLKKLVLGSYGGVLNPFSDGPLAALRQMNELRRLVLHSRTITHLGLAHIGALGRLESLEIKGTFDDRGVSELRALSSLKVLVLKGAFTDDAL